MAAAEAGKTRRRSGINFFRKPNAELSALSLEIDLGALSLAEGLRAAFGVALLVALNQILHWPLMRVVLLGTLFAALADIGGPMRRRMITIVYFSAIGALQLMLFSSLHFYAAWAVLPLALALLFSHAMLRIWGQNAQQVGNMLSVVMIFAIDVAGNWHHGLMLGTAFALGGLWALVLTLLVWRLHPYAPARRAVGAAYRQLAALADDLKSLLAATSIPPSAWDDHARAHRRAVRDAIELARDHVHQIAGNRGPASGVTVQSAIRLEAADEIFGVLIGLSALVQDDPAARPAAGRVLRLLAPLLRTIAQALERDETPATPAVARAIEQIDETAAAAPALAPALRELAERARLAVSVAVPPHVDMAPEDASLLRHPWLERAWDRLQSELKWSSANCRHAARTVLLAGLAVGFSLLTRQYYAHWLSITLVLTLQPFFANTRQRAIERSIGTALGVAGVTLLSVWLVTPVHVVMAMMPIVVVAFMLRRVSFALFITCLTPFVILLVELGRTDVTAHDIALQRMIYSLLGGAIAVVGNRRLWPIWEPLRLQAALGKALLAHAAWVLAPKTDDDVRRAAGRASNELETSIARALTEPRQHGGRVLELALVSDAALRRIGGHLTAVALQVRDKPMDMVWRGWIAENLRALAGQGSTAARPQRRPPVELVPVVQQIELMVAAFGRGEVKELSEARRDLA